MVSVKSGPGGGDADQAGDPFRAGQRDAQHQPAAQARADQYLRALRDAVEDGERVLGPAPDRAVGEDARRGAVAEIVETQVGAARRPAMVLERDRLGAGHIRHQTAQENHAGRLAGQHVVGDAVAVGAPEVARLGAVVGNVIGHG